MMDWWQKIASFWEPVRALLVEVGEVWGGGAVLVGLLVWLWRKMRKPKKHFPAGNPDFYKYYAEQIGKARKEVWVTSDGFNMNNPDSREYAAIMRAGFEKALGNGVVVRRFQILATMHINWLDELIAMKQSYGGCFRIFYNRAMENVSNVCAIDPDEKNCVSESMEHRTGKPFQATEAEDYVFDHRNKKKAEQTKRIVKNAIEDPATKEADVEALQQLKEDLLTERLEKFRVWREENPDSDNLSESGVFDEFVLARATRN